MGRDEGVGPRALGEENWWLALRRASEDFAEGCRRLPLEGRAGAQLGNVAQGLCVQTGSSGPSLTLTQAAERVLRGAGTRLNLSFQKFAHIWSHHSFT